MIKKSWQLFLFVLSWSCEVNRMNTQLPKDPVMLLSCLNTQLRDFYPSLADLCAAFDVNETEITEKLAAIDYHYDSETNRFCWQSSEPAAFWRRGSARMSWKSGRNPWHMRARAALQNYFFHAGRAFWNSNNHFITDSLTRNFRTDRFPALLCKIQKTDILIGYPSIFGECTPNLAVRDAWVMKNYISLLASTCIL